MEKLIIDGFEFNDFGANNYSEGMRLISAENSEELMEAYKRGLSIGECQVFYNPSAPCTKHEFYGVFGLESDYQKFYKRQKEAQIAKKMLDKFGNRDVPIKEWQAAEKEITDAYKDWWQN